MVDKLIPEYRQLENEDKRVYLLITLGKGASLSCFVITFGVFLLNVTKVILRAPAAITRQIISTVAKKSNSTEHFVNLNADYLHEKDTL